MALFSLSDLTKPASREDVQAAIYNVFATLGVNTTSWAAGAVVRTMVVATSAVLAAFSELQANIAASGFMELAEGSWLTLTARYVYNVERFEATFATGPLTLINSGGGVYVIQPEDLLVFNPTTEKSYRNRDAFTLGALGTLTITIDAVEAGTASNSAPNTITALGSVLLNVTCTNASPVVGADEESDESLRVRCREKLGSLSPNGPADAYAYVARNSVHPAGDNIGITRTRVLKDGYGNVTLIVAKPAGVVTPAELAIIDDNVQKLATPLAVASTTIAATSLSVTVTYTAWVYNTTGKSDPEILSLIADELTAFFEDQPIGGNQAVPSPGGPGFVYVSAILGAIAGTLPQIFRVVMTVPAADIVLAATEIPVLTTVTGTVIQVPPPEGAAT